MKRPLGRLIVATLLVTAPALANGRYPQANQLVVGPKDASKLVLRTTFGLVLSHDRGASWSWVCERAAGFVNGEDPPIEVTDDGSILVASSSSLALSHDTGCSWSPSLEDLSIVDADVDRSQPRRVVAIASLYLDGGRSSGLEQSVDNGNTWQAMGASFAGLPTTVALAPSLPTRVYAGGTSGPGIAPIVSRSDDSGDHWESFTVDVPSVTVPFLAAVDPTRPNIVYVRAPTSDGGDVLAVSSDSGAHWQQILRATGALAGFALSPDGTKIAAGGPADALRLASTADYQFSAASDVKPDCLTWTAAGLYACADEATSGFSLGISSDDGAHFAPLFHKKALSLEACPATTETGRYCPQAWETQIAILGIDAGRSVVDAGPINGVGDAGEPDASDGIAPFDAMGGDATVIGTAEVDAARTDGAEARTDGAEVEERSDASAAPGSSSSSCSCRLSSRPLPSWSPIWIGLALLGWLRSRGRAQVIVLRR